LTKAEVKQHQANKKQEKLFHDFGCLLTKVTADVERYKRKITGL
jgi:hypothetical protein